MFEETEIEKKVKEMKFYARKCPKCGKYFLTENSEKIIYDECLLNPFKKCRFCNKELPKGYPIAYCDECMTSGRVKSD
jgi:hypothetical protein